MDTTPSRKPMGTDNRSGSALSEQKSHADIIAEMQWQAKQPVMASGGETFHPVDESDVLDFARELDAAHKREIAVLRDALAEVVASIEVRFTVIEHALDRKPYLDAKKVLERFSTTKKPKGDIR